MIRAHGDGIPDARGLQLRGLGRVTVARPHRSQGSVGVNPQLALELTGQGSRSVKLVLAGRVEQRKR